MLNRKSDQYKESFFDGILTPDRPPLPLAPIAIKNLRSIRTLAEYMVVPDDYDLNYKLTLNEKLYVEGQTENG